MSVETNAARSSRSQACHAIQFLLAIFTSTLAIVAYGPHGGIFFYILLATSAASFAALILGWGWLVPCLIIGTILGAMSDPSVKGGTIESQMQETCGYIGSGTFLGLLVGLGADAASTACEKERNDDSRPA